MSKHWQGKRVVITRPLESIKDTAAAITQKGAIPVPLPCIRREAIPLPEAVQQEWRSRFEFDWIFFTSAFAVRRFCEVLHQLNVTLPLQTRVAAIGEKTAQAARRAGLKVAFVAPPGDSVHFVRHFLKHRFSVQRVLHPTGRQAEGQLEEELHKAQIPCTRVDLYENRPCVTPDMLQQALAEPVHALTFFSGSAVRAFFTCAARTPGISLTGVPVVVLGKQTAEAAREFAARPVVVAPEATLNGIITALDRCFIALHTQQDHSMRLI